MSSLLVEPESRNGSSEPESQNGPSPSVDLKTEPDLADRRTDPSAIDESLPINVPVTGNPQPSSLVVVEEKEESEHREAVASPTPSNAPPTSEAAVEGDQNLEEFGTAPPTSGSSSNAPSEISPAEQPTSEAAAVGDQKSYKSGTAPPTSENGSNAPPEISPAEQMTQPEPRNEEEARTITMRDLLNGFKDDESSRPDMASPDSERSSQQQQYQHPDQDNTAMDLIGSVTGIDEEGRSRQRILTYAARRYASAVERNPGDYDALYNWALVLQESADNVDPDSTSPSKDALLEEACKKYEEATRLCPTLNDAYYNWAIAISDRARMRGRTKEAEELWKQATQHYEKAVQLNWNSPQALNNWGLALQELSAIVPAKEKQTIVRTAINKFRAAIQLQFDFHRAIYNLGTVLYGLAEDTLRVGATGIKETSANELYSQCAIYIAAAHALKPNYSVYRSALKLVRSMLPLPYLKVGYMTAAPSGNPISPHKEWKRTQFVLNHEGLYQLIADEQRQMRRSLSGNTIDAQNGKRQSVKVEIADIVSVSACADLTLPPGAGLSIDTIHGPIYLVADSWESLDGWLDALRLVYTIFARGKSEVLAGIITG